MRKMAAILPTDRLRDAYVRVVVQIEGRDSLTTRGPCGHKQPTKAQHSFSDV